jgi:hypothetical protein
LPAAQFGRRHQQVVLGNGSMMASPVGPRGNFGKPQIPFGETMELLRPAQGVRHRDVTATTPSRMRERRRTSRRT